MLVGLRVRWTKFSGVAVLPCVWVCLATLLKFCEYQYPYLQNGEVKLPQVVKLQWWTAPCTVSEQGSHLVIGISESSPSLQEGAGEETRHLGLWMRFCSIKEKKRESKRKRQKLQAYGNTGREGRKHTHPNTQLDGLSFLEAQIQLGTCVHFLRFFGNLRFLFYPPSAKE